MSGARALIIILVILAVLVPLLIWASVLLARRTSANLQWLARQLGLDFQPTTGWTEALPRVSGTLRGKPAEVFTYSTGSGKSRKTWAAVSVRPAGGGGLTFVLQKQDLGTKISELFGAREITVGDPVFDAAWFIRTNQPDYLRPALLPEIREKLMAVRRAGARGKFECNGGVVKYAEMGSFYQWQRSERFVALADVVVDLAEVAEVAGTIEGPA